MPPLCGAAAVNPFEMADYAAFIAAAWVGLVVGRRMRPRPPEPLKPMCSCAHGFGTHEDGRRCNSEIEQASSWSSCGTYPVSWRWVPCPCLRYDGPDPAIFGLLAPPST